MAHDELGSLIDAAAISLPRKPPAAWQCPGLAVIERIRWERQQERK
jgi:hypothetical protein